MSDIDNDVVLNAGAGGPNIKTYFEDAAAGSSAGHYQLMMVAFDGAAGGDTADIAARNNPLPVDIPIGYTTVGGYIQDIWTSLTADGAGGTAMYVDISPSSEITVSAIVEDLIVGITTEGSFAQIAVYGTGGTAVGVTGSVYILDTASVTGTVAIDSSSVIGISGSPDVLSTTGIPMFGTGGTAVGITGSVYVLDHASVTGEVDIVTMPTVSVNISSGITNGKFSGDLTSGTVIGSGGLSSGIRVSAFSTGISTDYVYVGATLAYGSESLTAYGHPLREMESVFVEVNNLNQVYVISDNTSVDVRWIAS
jgi:hypothetical protein